MADILLEISAVLAILTISIAASLFFSDIKKFQNEFQFIGWFVVAGSITELAALILANNHIPNIYLLHIYSIVEYLLLVLFFVRLFKRWNIIIPVLPILLPGILWIIYDSFIIKSSSEINNYSRFFIHIMVIIAIIFTLFKAFEKELTIHRKSLYFILTALLLNYSGSLFIYFFSDLISTLTINTQFGIYTGKALINVFANILFIIAFLRITTE